MGKPQRRFGKEFEAEAVRLVEVSGRTQMDLDLPGICGERFRFYTARPSN